MRMSFSRNYIALLFFIFVSCDKLKFLKKEHTPEYSSVPDVVFIEDTGINEISGICESINFNNHLWVHDDGPEVNEIRLINKNGSVNGKLTLPFLFRDVEDIAIGSGPKAGSSYIYLAETGDNNIIYDQYCIYRFEEPKGLVSDLPIEKIDVIKFKYPDGSHDTECMLLDPVTKDIYLVTKREEKVGLYKLSYPQDTHNLQIATFIQRIPLTYITSGGISEDGKQIALMTYTSIFVWNKTQSETVSQTLVKEYTFLPYVILEQGEAFCFAKNSNGYYTSGESLKPKFNFYRRKN